MGKWYCLECNTMEVNELPQLAWNSVLKATAAAATTPGEQYNALRFCYAIRQQQLCYGNDGNPP
jgi:hypothetical protein